MEDPTENQRRMLTEHLNAQQAEREVMEHEHGKVWDTNELREDFEVLGFLAPFCVVRRKSDGVKGSVMFQHHPRYYFGWKEDS
jgi:hypothetical protein